MKRILIASICTLLFAGMAYATDLTVPVTATITAPFTTTAGQDVNMGTIYATAASNTIKMDTSGCAAATGTAVVADAVFTNATGTITAPAGADIGVVNVTTAATGLTLQVTFDATTSVDMTTGFAGSSTIAFTGMTSNVSLVNAANATAGTYDLAVGPIIDVPANCSAGTYSGTLGFALNAI